jgi:hypothetical protein
MLKASLGSTESNCGALMKGFEASVVDGTIGLVEVGFGIPVEVGSVEGSAREPACTGFCGTEASPLSPAGGEGERGVGSFANF